jgi:hypothetical protein
MPTYLSFFQCLFYNWKIQQSEKGLSWLILVSYLRSAVTAQADYISWMTAQLNPSV